MGEELSNGGHGQEKLSGMTRQTTELVMLIEALCIFIYRVHYDTDGADFAGILPTALQGIHQQKLP